MTSNIDQIKSIWIDKRPDGFFSQQINLFDHNGETWISVYDHDKGEVIHEAIIRKNNQSSGQNED